MIISWQEHFQKKKKKNYALKQLLDLWLQHDSRCYFELDSLSDLDLDQNMLKETIPKISVCTDSHLDLSHNYLLGSIPGSVNASVKPEEPQSYLR